MGIKNDRRAVTLSISITPELHAEVASRVDSGLYTSASELVREALRLLLRTEREGDRFREAQIGDSSPSTTRFGEAGALMDLGLRMRVEKLRRAEPELSPAEVLARLSGLADAQEAGPGLRIAADRLEELRLE